MSLKITLVFALHLVKGEGLQTWWLVRFSATTWMMLLQQFLSCHYLVLLGARLPLRDLEAKCPRLLKKTATMEHLVMMGGHSRLYKVE